MIRKLSLAVAVATALSPLGAFALGLGDIQTRSALNQYFKADIDLLSVSKEELQDVRVSLGSPQAFAKAGIERPFLLSGLKFTPSIAIDGRPVISISSKDPIREPFLNFLVEVNWPKGRLLREYTVLLDPPLTLERKPEAVQAPVVRTAPARQPEPVSKPRKAAAPAYTAPSVSSGVTSAGAREYGPIQTNENLWQIAKRMQRPGESTEQLMLALQRYNPDAFIKNNVNGLKVGKILRLPEDADVTSLSRREARQEFLAQTRAWREGREMPAAAAPRVGVKPQAVAAKPKPTTEPTDRLELISAKPEAAEEVPTQEGRAEQGDKITQLEQEILLVRESNESARQENEDLRARIRELEAQITDIQRLVTLRSDQLTELQTAEQLVEEKIEAMPEAEPAVTAEVSPEAVSPEEVSPEAVSPVSAEDIREVDIEAIVTAAMVAEKAATEVVTPAEPDITAMPETAQVEPAPAPITQPAEVLAPEPESKLAAKAPETLPARASQKSGFLDTLSGNPTLMGIIGAAVIVMLSLLWLIVRRRKEAEAEFAESILVTPSGEAAVEAVQGAGGSISEPTDDTSFMSDFSPSDIDALQDETGEVDPLSEADVYIAYGRYQQAEELIKQAIERSPEREELKHKLLEIYYSAKNTGQFVGLAQELQQSGLEKEKPDVWSKIAAMGKELDPSNALFAAAAGAVAGAAMGAEEDELEDLGLGLDSKLEDDSILTADQAPAEAADDLDSMDLSGLDNLDEMDSENLESELSLDSEFFDKIESEAAEKPKEALAEAEGLDIDLDQIETQAESAEEAIEDSLATVSTLETPDEISALDLDAVDTASQTVAEDSVMSFDDSETLDDLDLESLEKELESLSVNLESAPEDEDELKLAEEAAADDGLDLDSTDEVTTKLDLARAYVDMGDTEGAKNILGEVINEGSEMQKQEAQELLENLPG